MKLNEKEGANLYYPQLIIKGGTHNDQPTQKYLYCDYVEFLVVGIRDTSHFQWGCFLGIPFGRYRSPL